MTTANAEERKVLGIRFCPTCAVDTMILNSGFCPFCNVNPDTGKVDEAAERALRLEQRRRRNADAVAAYRARKNAA